MTTSSQHPPHHRSVVSYVQRGERMTVGQQRAWDRHWERLGREVKALPAGPVDFAAWFGREAPVLLEIGSGMGETTARLVAAAPELNYVAVEVYKPGLAQLLMRAEALGVDNLRVLRGDAVDLLTEHVAPGSLAGVRIFFPDPWPKKKHHKRRLVQPAFVGLLATRLAPGGTLHLATDWENYAEQMLAVCSAEPLLRNRHAGWAPRPDWRPVTKFEQRAVEEDRASHDLVFERVGPA
ncbi:tRNA (guanosine(46)-N7)-methyltransferase TrmB [Saccharothrix algeriensis]|uniref:tRNA (guanine-N(7)-)-methyltransferase n=2 Tax=Saccharothrix algeriensis TaxID=173560 RepID=A0A8T8I531_9PSEU|nr:tRNA (guanine-N7-)-methyltransferase [Saccharothrix algeriensis]QTR05877.1 tRNA (guanosine(46)-N7)-methyltransferase TrmB [Saccharothrix algeriensis]